MHDATGTNVSKLSNEKRREVAFYVDKKLSIYKANPRIAFDLYVKKVEELLENHTIERRVE